MRGNGLPHRCVPPSAAANVGAVSEGTFVRTLNSDMSFETICFGTADLQSAFDEI
jgi:hypothetical protein